MLASVNTLPSVAWSSRRISSRRSKIEDSLYFHWAASDAVLQSHAIEEFHNEENASILLPDFIDCADVGMVECRRRPSLTTKPFERLRVSGQVFRKEFQGNKAAKLGVFGFVHDAHPTPAELLDDAVMRDGLAKQGLGFWHLRRY
jgi:hypothetical protein